MENRPSVRRVSYLWIDMSAHISTDTQLIYLSIYISIYLSIYRPICRPTTVDRLTADISRNMSTEYRPICWPGASSTPGSTHDGLFYLPVQYCITRGISNGGGGGGCSIGEERREGEVVMTNWGCRRAKY